jgi:hypothetical protein
VTSQESASSSATTSATTTTPSDEQRHRHATPTLSNKQRHHRATSTPPDEQKQRKSKDEIGITDGEEGNKRRKSIETMKSDVRAKTTTTTTTTKTTTKTKDGDDAKLKRNPTKDAPLPGSASVACTRVTGGKMETTFDGDKIKQNKNSKTDQKTNAKMNISSKERDEGEAGGRRISKKEVLQSPARKKSINESDV